MELGTVGSQRSDDAQDGDAEDSDEEEGPLLSLPSPPLVGLKAHSLPPLASTEKSAGVVVEESDEEVLDPWHELREEYRKVEACFEAELANRDDFGRALKKAQTQIENSQLADKEKADLEKQRGQLLGGYSRAASEAAHWGGKLSRLKGTLRKKVLEDEEAQGGGAAAGVDAKAEEDDAGIASEASAAAGLEILPHSKEEMEKMRGLQMCEQDRRKKTNTNMVLPEGAPTASKKDLGGEEQSSDDDSDDSDLTPMENFLRRVHQGKKQTPQQPRRGPTIREVLQERIANSKDSLASEEEPYDSAPSWDEEDEEESETDRQSSENEPPPLNLGHLLDHLEEPNSASMQSAAVLEEGGEDANPENPNTSEPPVRPIWHSHPVVFYAQDQAGVSDPKKDLDSENEALPLANLANPLEVNNQALTSAPDVSDEETPPNAGNLPSTAAGKAVAYFLKTGDLEAVEELSTASGERIADTDKAVELGEVSASFLMGIKRILSGAQAIRGALQYEGSEGSVFKAINLKNARGFLEEAEEFLQREEKRTGSFPGVVKRTVAQLWAQIAALEGGGEPLVKKCGHHAGADDMFMF